MVDPAEGVQATTGAQANAVIVGAEGSDVSLRSSQRLQGSVRAETEVTVRGYSPTIAATSAAAGNIAEASVVDGNFNAEVEQSIDGGEVAAWTGVTANLSSSGDTVATAAAVGNGFNSAAVSNNAHLRTDQRHDGAGTTARTQAELFHVQGQAALTATAAANQMGYTGRTYYSEVRADQSNSGATDASVRGDIGNGYLTSGMAAAAANTVHVAHQAGVVEASVRQANSGYVGARSELATYEYGGATSQAFGVGNAVGVEQLGEVLTLDTDQTNSGGVEVMASFDGGYGYDAQVSASAVGNTVSASVCSDCDGALTANNSQANYGDVSAFARTDIGGSSRSVTGTVSAVGNSASYYVTKPKH